MGAYIDYIELITTTELKAFCFDLPKDAESNLVNEIYSIRKQNELLAEHTIKNEVSQLLSKYKHVNDIHEHRKHHNKWTT